MTKDDSGAVPWTHPATFDGKGSIGLERHIRYIRRGIPINDIAQAAFACRFDISRIL